MTFIKTYIGDGEQVEVTEDEVRDNLEGAYQDIDEVIQLLKDNPNEKLARSLWAVFEAKET